MSSQSLPSLVRPLVRRLTPYVPGEQPKIRGLIKLNTNENPYPPSPKVLAAVKAAVDGRLRLYPNPTAEPLRAKAGPAARLPAGEPHRRQRLGRAAGTGGPGLCGASAARARRGARRAPARIARVQYFTPSYSLYPVLAEIHGAARNRRAARARISACPACAELRRGRAMGLPRGADLHHHAQRAQRPRLPHGRNWTRFAALSGAWWCSTRPTWISPARTRWRWRCKHPHVLVARTFSKAYSLCFQRVGYFVGHPDLIAALHKIRDSYNVNGLGQVAARGHARRPALLPRATSARSSPPASGSAASWPGWASRSCPARPISSWSGPPRFPARDMAAAAARPRKILVRWFGHPEVRDYLRISIGTPDQAAVLVAAAKKNRGSVERRASAPARPTRLTCLTCLTRPTHQSESLEVGARNGDRQKEVAVGRALAYRGANLRE